MILLDPARPVVEFVVDQAQQTVEATWPLERWLSILGGLIIVLSFLGVVWAKGIRPLLRKLDYVEGQMSSNGKVVQTAGTEDLNLREALDQNTADTKAVRDMVDEVAHRLNAHLEWSSEEADRQTAIAERVVALEQAPSDDSSPKEST